MSESLSDLRRDCVQCRDDAVFTGEVERRPDGLYMVVRCPHGHEAAVHRADWTSFVERHLALAASDPDYRAGAEALLAGRLPAPTSGCAPMLRARYLSLELAEAAASLLLEHPRLEPPPTTLERAEEAAILAVRAPDSGATTHLAGWLARSPIREALLSRLAERSDPGYAALLARLAGAPASPAPRARPVRFVRSGDVAVPYRADVDGHAWTLRRNAGFPVDERYTLLVDGAEREHFTEWPLAWPVPD
jgi:hypothetical protein